jgi:ribosomal protein S25
MIDEKERRKGRIWEELQRRIDEEERERFVFPHEVTSRMLADEFNLNISHAKRVLDAAVEDGKMKKRFVSKKRLYAYSLIEPE